MTDALKDDLLALDIRDELANIKGSAYARTFSFSDIEDLLEGPHKPASLSDKIRGLFSAQR